MHQEQVGFIPYMQRQFNIHKFINVIHPLNRIIGKSHAINLINAEKTLDKFYHPFIWKTLEKLGIEVTYLNILKAICDKPKANKKNEENLKACPLNSRTRQGCTLTIHI